jgi:hypothetical protein
LPVQGCIPGRGCCSEWAFRGARCPRISGRCAPRQPLAFWFAPATASRCEATSPDPAPGDRRTATGSALSAIRRRGRGRCLPAEVIVGSAWIARWIAIEVSRWGDSGGNASIRGAGKMFPWHPQTPAFPAPRVLNESRRQKLRANSAPRRCRPKGMTAAQLTGPFPRRLRLPIE